MVTLLFIIASNIIMPETGAITFFFALKCEEPKGSQGRKLCFLPSHFFSENGVMN